MLTNQLRRSASHLIGRYTQRMLIENGIADGIDFLHMDSLSSAVAMKVSCDLPLTLMASDLINAVANVMMSERETAARFRKRAHIPLALAAGFADTDLPVPWLGGTKLRLLFG